MTMHGCQPYDLIMAATGLIAAVTALVRQFQHEQKVSQQTAATTDATPPAATGKPAP